MTLAKEGLKVIVDSSDRIGLYTGVILKPNEVEGTRAVRNTTEQTDMSLQEYADVAIVLAEHTNSKVCMTLGSKGCVYTDSQSAIHIPSSQVPPPIDICGAGDTFLSVFSCAYAAGAAPQEAASFANLAANVAVKKVGITGTASPEEIKNRFKEI